MSPLVKCAVIFGRSRVVYLGCSHPGTRHSCFKMRTPDTESVSVERLVQASMEAGWRPSIVHTSAIDSHTRINLLIVAIRYHTSELVGHSSICRLRNTWLLKCNKGGFFDPPVCTLQCYLLRNPTDTQSSGIIWDVARNTRSHIGLRREGVDSRCRGHVGWLLCLVYGD